MKEFDEFYLKTFKHCNGNAEETKQWIAEFGIGLLEELKDPNNGLFVDFKEALHLAKIYDKANKQIAQLKEISKP